MAHRYLVSFLIGAACLIVVVLSLSNFAYGEDLGVFTGGRESLAVLVAGVGLSGIGFVARRHLRRREEKEIGS